MSPEELREEVIDSLDFGSRKFQSSQAGTGYSSFCDAAFDHLIAQLHSPASADGENFTNSTKLHEPGTRFTAWQSDFDDHMKQMHCDCIIIAADKLPNNCMVVYQKH